MKNVVDIVKELTKNMTNETLAKEIGVSPSTINRWINGKSKPQPRAEGKIRELNYTLKNKTKLLVKEPSISLQYDIFPKQDQLLKASDTALQDLREELHRRGRLSSRNEALDEISKIFFINAATNFKLNEDIINNKNNKSIAYNLRKFAEDIYKKNLPNSLAHEMELDDFQLNLKENENELALEIIKIINNFNTAIETCNISNINKNLFEVDLINDLFGKFLANSYVDEKQLGQYLTPPEVVRFMANLAINDLDSSEFDLLCHPEDCVSFGKILDPSCGVASFLVEIIKTLRAEVIKRHGENKYKTWLKNITEHVLIGIDKSDRMIRFALTNMAMYGAPSAQLHLANSLLKSNRKSDDITLQLENKSKIILTNPPFGAEFNKQDLIGYKISEIVDNNISINSEVLFLERYFDWLLLNGQLLSIVPDSILTNKGFYEKIRKQLAPNIKINSIISLPPVTFSAAGTNTKTSILHLTKLNGKSRNNHRTFFAVCNNIGYDVRTKNSLKTKKIHGNSELPEILKSKYNNEPHIGSFRSDIEHSDRWDANYHISLPQDIEIRLNTKSVNDIYLKQVAHLINERTDPRRWGMSKFKYIEISDIDPVTYMIKMKEIPCNTAPSRARKFVKEDDVLFSTVRPERKTIGVVQKEHDGAVCSTGLAVLRPISVPPLLLAKLLSTDFVNLQILRHMLGIAYPAIDENILPSLLLPMSKNNLNKFITNAKELYELEYMLKNKRALFNKSVQEMIDRFF